jgi:hypothetical protein
MRMQSCEESMKALKEARHACSGQLDDGALCELDRAINSLETALEHGRSVEDVERLKLRALQALAALVSIATNVSEWMK